MMTNNRLMACLLAASLLSPVPAAFAAETPDFTIMLSQQDRRDLERVETYLSTQTSIKAEFVQTVTQYDGRQNIQTGMLRLQLPGKLRIDYTPPNKDFMVSDGRMLYAWDDLLQQQSQVALSDTLAGLILRSDLKFDGEKVTPVSVKHPSPGRMEITLRSAKDPEAGTLTLFLSEVPFHLTGWSVQDAQGLTTTVELSNIEQNLGFDKALFVFRSPSFSSQKK
jgi:outer membrane lipoprotein-sorting protein